MANQITDKKLIIHQDSVSYANKLILHTDIFDKKEDKTAVLNGGKNTSYNQYGSLLEDCKISNQFEKKRDDRKKPQTKQDNKFGDLYKTIKKTDFHKNEDISKIIEKRLKGIAKKIVKEHKDQNLEVNDMFFVNVIIKAYKEYILFDVDAGKWLWWTGKQWKYDNESIVYGFCMKTIYELKEYLKADTKFGQDVSALQAYGNHRAVRSVMNMLKTRCQCHTTDFDNSKHLLNVSNGTVNLITKKLQKHNPNDKITKIVNVDFRENEIGKKFRKFVLEISNHDEELAEYLQIAYGYLTTGETREQCIFLESGNGANGKSTLNSVINEIMEDYVDTVSFDLFKRGSGGSASGPSPELAKLPAKRLVFCSETSTAPLNEAKIKEITGGEKITARALYSDPFTYLPQFTLVFETNSKPTINGADFGIWRRIVVIPFLCKFKKNPSLKDELLQEKEAILNWLIEGAYRYYKNGLPKCRAVKTATERYMEAEDTVGAFVKYCLKDDKDSRCRAKDMYAAYERFCNEECRTPLNIKEFKRGMEAKGYTGKRVNSGMMWLGVRLKNCVAAENGLISR